MTKGVQTIAALMDDSMSGDRLIGATRQLCDAFSDLLQAAEPEKQEVRGDGARVPVPSDRYIVMGCHHVCLSGGWLVLSAVFLLRIGDSFV